MTAERAPAIPQRWQMHKCHECGADLKQLDVNGRGYELLLDLLLKQHAPRCPIQLLQRIVALLETLAEDTSDYSIRFTRSPEQHDLHPDNLGKP